MATPSTVDQATIIPTLFVGLGGVGSRIVDRIARRAAGLPNWESQLRDLNAFVSIDTNELDQNSLQAIPRGNRINIAAFDKARVVEHWRRAKDAQTRDWIDESYQPRPGFNPGAGQIRLESRLGFFYHSPEIRKRLDELVGDLLASEITWRQSHPPKINCYLFCTLAGGTGSGSFLSAAYLVDEVIRKRHWQPRVTANLMLSTLLTDKVGPELHADIHANTYAALKELEHLTKLDYDQIKQTGRTREPFAFGRNQHGDAVPEVTRRPFFMSFIFDQPPHLDLHNSESAIADAAYLQVFTPIIDKMAGELDNYEKNLEGLTRYPGDLSDVGEGYAKNFGAFGAAALVLPGNDLLDYCALRFAAQAIRTQITFGMDQAAAGDERALALAKLAVDYADPRFQKLSEQGQEDQINDAFVRSVRELSRQDEKDELLDGFWHRLVESVDEGRVTGTDAKGQEQRGESLMQAVERRLGEQRNQLITRISIKDRSLFFPKEAVGVYIDTIGKLEDEVRLGHQLVAKESEGLVSAAADGDAIIALGLDPIAERYLVVRLLERCEGQWLPGAEAQLAKAEKADLLTNPNVRKRLREEIYAALQRAAGSRAIFNRDREFEQVRAEAQAEYSRTREAALRLLDARVRLGQLRALLDYLKRRSRQFVRLATRMDRLVKELEAEAERMRRGEVARIPPLALRVEIFQTMDGQRPRVWDLVYDRMFVADGHSLSTFDRQALAEAISKELKPVVGEDGRVCEKTIDQTATDLRRALIDLGRSRLGPSILGDADQGGLDVIGGLALEAELVLASGSGEVPSEEEVIAYQTTKLRALGQISGVLARVSSADAKALADGVVVNRTRQIVIGVDTESGAGALAFERRLVNVLGESGRQVKIARWSDPRMIVVHDVELPIPLYYFPLVTGDIEEAYLRVFANEQRGYHLHTDFRWERSLPNLNPLRSELGVSWALQSLADGLLNDVVGHDGTQWLWRDAAGMVVMPLHPLLSGVLYKLGEIHTRERLRLNLEAQIEQSAARVGPETLALRSGKLRQWLEQQLVETDVKEMTGTVSKADYLDRPVIRALQRLLRDAAPAPASDAQGPIGYASLKWDDD